jgi:hypothetical protein
MGRKGQRDTVGLQFTFLLLEDKNLASARQPSLATSHCELPFWLISSCASAPPTRGKARPENPSQLRKRKVINLIEP